jgi:hypothetical protein
VTRTPTRRPRITSAVGATLALAVSALGAPPAQAAPASSSVVAVAVGADGRLYSSLIPAAPNPVPTNGVIAPPGAGISAATQANGGLAVFTIGTQGGLVAGRPNPASGIGLVFFADGPSNLAPPGGNVTALSSLSDIHVFFAGYDGAIYHTRYYQLVGPGSGPRAITPVGIARPGAPVAAVLLPNRTPAAVFAGTNGALFALTAPNGTWTTRQISPTGVTTPGSTVAAATTATGAAVFFTSPDGALLATALSAASVTPPWQYQVISGPGTLPAGARPVAARLPNGTLEVAFAGQDGALWTASNASGNWSAPQAATQPGIIATTAPISLTIADEFLWVAWCGNDEVWIFGKRWPVPPRWDVYRVTAFSFRVGAGIALVTL